MTDDIRILITDDHLVVRKGLAQVFEEAAGMTVVAEAASGEEAIYLSQKLRPDVVFMDLKMEGLGGVEATRVISGTGSAGAVIGLSTFSEPGQISAMMSAGAKGYVLKEALAADILDAVRRVHAGETLVPSVAAEAPNGAGQTVPETPQLGAQQRRVLALMTKGLTNPEIAEQLSVSRATVGYHVSAILRKLDVSNRAEAVALAVRSDLVGSEDL